MNKIAITRECTLTCLPGSIVIVSDAQSKLVREHNLGEPVADAAKTKRTKG